MSFNSLTHHLRPRLPLPWPERRQSLLPLLSLVLSSPHRHKTQDCFSVRVRRFAPPVLSRETSRKQPEAQGQSSSGSFSCPVPRPRTLPWPNSSLPSTSFGNGPVRACNVPCFGPASLGLPWGGITIKHQDKCHPVSFFLSSSSSLVSFGSALASPDRPLVCRLGASPAPSPRCLSLPSLALLWPGRARPRSARLTRPLGCAATRDPSPLSLFFL